MVRTIKSQTLICKIILLQCVFLVASVSIARADTVTVNLLELQLALDEANSTEDSVSRALFNRISDTINESELGFVDGELLYQNSDTNITVEGGCNRTVILRLQTDILLLSDSSMSLTLDSLYDPIVIELDVTANVHSAGEARQIVGIRLGSCQNLARNSFVFSADGAARFSLSATLNLNPLWTDESTLSLYPRLSLDGELIQFDTTVKVDDTILAGILENYIEDSIDETFTNSRLASELQLFENTVNHKLTESLSDGRIDIELPEATDEQIIGLYQLLQPDARFPITLDFIRKHRQQLLSSLLFGESTSTDAILSDALLCESASRFLHPVITEPVYGGTPERCSVVDSTNIDSASVFSDMACTEAIIYNPTSVSEYCDVTLDPERLGNAASLPSELGHWTHNPGSRFDISALSTVEITQPFMRRFRYKSIPTNRGLCELEMRVYSQASNRTSRPLLALHGGSWQHRASGFIGIETMATHFTDNGFTVFAPFYRLIGESDGNMACNDASLDDVLDDVNDALDWIHSHTSEFDLTGKSTVFGQSAGGHLALSLATYRAAEIRRAVLFYAPTDFADFAKQIQLGEYTNSSGLKILEAVTGESVESLDTQSRLVRENSFPAMIVESPSSFPPMFIMHGEMDSLLPARQSTRLCNALSGSRDFNRSPERLTMSVSEFASTSLCGDNGSQMHLIAEGEHALDLCLAPGLCLSGSERSADTVAQSIQSMLDWSSAERVDLESQRMIALGQRMNALGTGALSWPILALFLVVACGTGSYRRSRCVANNAPLKALWF